MCVYVRPSVFELTKRDSTADDARRLDREFNAVQSVRGYAQRFLIYLLG